MLLGRSYWELVLVRAFIFFFSYLGLGCLCYFVLIAAIRGVGGIIHPVSITIEAIGVIEITWYLAFFLPLKARLQRPETRYNPEPLTRTQRKALFYRGISLVPDLEYFIRKWLLNAHWDDIRRENIKEWLLWALFERDGGALDDNPELEDYIAEVEEQLGANVKRGWGEAKSLRLTFDNVRMRHRSLLYYSIIGFLDTLTTIALLILGFQFFRQGRRTFFKVFPFRPMTLLSPNASPSPYLTYFHRPHKSPSRRPILFIHGIGVGPLPYLMWLNSVPSDVGVIVIELLPVASRICAPMPSTTELATAINTILSHHSFNDFVLVGHSYGTFLAAPLLNRPDIAPKINSVVLIDPVSMLLHLPEVAFNITRRKPQTANEWQIWWGAAADPGTAHTLARRLCWRESILWREQLEGGVGRRSTAIVAGKDCVLHAQAVASYVYFGDTNYTAADVEEWKTTAERWDGTGELELVWLPELDHGQVFFKRGMMPLLGKVVDTYCKRDGWHTLDDGIDKVGV